MLESWLSRIFFNQWAVLILVSLLLLFLGEAGHRFGMIARKKNVEVAQGHGGSVQGAVLGLLGLLLGFTFAMAVGRHDTRRQLAVDEANSIGTTWLRCEFLGQPASQEARKLLRRYTEIRLEAQEKARDPAAQSSLLAESNNIQNSLWNLALKVAVEKPDPVTASFITTLNETIDLQSSRLAAKHNHVSGVVWLLLLLVAGCGAWASGYGSGTAGHRSAFNQVVFPLLIGVVITLISDIDRPDKGLIGVSQESLRELLESMN